MKISSFIWLVKLKIQHDIAARGGGGGEHKKHKNKLYIKHLTSIFTYFLFLSQNITGSKEGNYKGGLIASTPHHKKEQNETATKVPPWDGQ